MIKERCAIRQPKLRGPSKAALKEAKAVLKAHRRAKDERSSATEIQCSSFFSEGAGCGAFHRIDTLTYIQTHYYISPYGCSGGDYWLQGEGQWKCPACGHVNRLYEHTDDIVPLKRFFKGVEDTYPPS